MYLRFDQMSDFDAWLESVNNFYGFPNQHGTTQYTQPIESGGFIYAPVFDNIDHVFINDNIAELPEMDNS